MSTRPKRDNICSPPCSTHPIEVALYNHPSTEFGDDYPSVIGTNVIVSFPKMSMTLTASV